MTITAIHKDDEFGARWAMYEAERRQRLFDYRGKIADCINKLPESSASKENLEKDIMLLHDALNGEYAAGEEPVVISTVVSMTYEKLHDIPIREEYYGSYYYSSYPLLVMAIAVARWYASENHRASLSIMDDTCRDY